MKKFIKKWLNIRTEDVMLSNIFCFESDTQRDKNGAINASFEQLQDRIDKLEQKVSDSFSAMKDLLEIEIVQVIEKVNGVPTIVDKYAFKEYRKTKKSKK